MDAAKGLIVLFSVLIDSRTNCLACGHVNTAYVCSHGLQWEVFVLLLPKAGMSEVSGAHLSRDFFGRCPSAVAVDCPELLWRMPQVPSTPGVSPESLQPYVTYEACDGLWHCGMA